MSNRKTNYKPDYFASMNGKHETFGMIYNSLLRAEKFQELPDKAQQIYVILQCHKASKENRQTLYKHGQEENKTYNDNCFVFPPKHQILYGLNDRSNVQKYLRKLERAGFIERYEKNGHRQKVNVYRFSANWKNKE